MFDSLDRGLNGLFKDPNEGLFQKYFDVLAWVRSHREGITYNEAVKGRARVPDLHQGPKGPAWWGPDPAPDAVTLNSVRPVLRSSSSGAFHAIHSGSPVGLHRTRFGGDACSIHTRAHQVVHGTVRPGLR